MNAESELNLYNHVDFLNSNQMDRSKIDLNSKKKKIPAKAKMFKAKNKAVNTTSKYDLRKPKIKPILDANELLFFSRKQDPTPLKHSSVSKSDFYAKNDFMRQIKVMTAQEKRLFRSKNDLRHSTRNSKNARNKEDKELFCFDHLTDQCNRNNCNKWHQMRNPRIFGVCKFYITDSCTKGSFCEYMHSDFPCRYYYLNLNHDENKCRFKHGGPLNGRIHQYFTKHIQHWVTTLTKDKPLEFEKVLQDYMTKFDDKQIRLEQEYKAKSILMPELNDENDEEFSLDRVLARNQIDMLLEKGFRTAAEVNSVPVDELLSFGLTIDQIYEISKNTSCNKVAGDENHCKDALSNNVDVDTSENKFFSDESNKTPQPHDLYSEPVKEICDANPQQTITDTTNNNSDSDDDDVDKLIISEE